MSFRMRKFIRDFLFEFVMRWFLFSKNFLMVGIRRRGQANLICKFFSSSLISKEKITAVGGRAFRFEKCARADRKILQRDRGWCIEKNFPNWL